LASQPSAGKAIKVVAFSGELDLGLPFVKSLAKFTS